MAELLLESEVLLKEKKRLYKNWKFYATALGIIVIGTGTGLGIYYGINTNHSQLIKIDLSTLELETTIQGTENMTKETAFQTFLNLNQEKHSDLKVNVETGSFTAPIYTTSGSLEINAKENSKYNGTITVTINAIGQTNLTELELNTNISGTENMTEETAFQTFLNLNQEKYPDLKTNVEAGTFTAPTYTSEGKLEITAKENSKYTSTTTVTINAIGQTNLTDLELNTTISGNEGKTNQEAFNTFLSNNNTIVSDLKDNVEAGTFTAPSFTTAGSLTINATATGKYTGTITVNITFRVLTEREQILQRIKEAHANNDNDSWLMAWQDYLNAIDSLINDINYVLTKDQLTDNKKIQNALFNQLRINVIEELIKWNIPKGYDEESIRIDYLDFKILDNTITATVRINLLIQNLNSPLQFNFDKLFQYTIHYEIRD